MAVRCLLRLRDASMGALNKNITSEEHRPRRDRVKPCLSTPSADFICCSPGFVHFARHRRVAASSSAMSVRRGALRLLHPDPQTLCFSAAGLRFRCCRRGAEGGTGARTKAPQVSVNRRYNQLREQVGFRRLLGAPRNWPEPLSPPARPIVQAADGRIDCHFDSKDFAPAAGANPAPRGGRGPRLATDLQGPDLFPQFIPRRSLDQLLSGPAANTGISFPSLPRSQMRSCHGAWSWLYDLRRDTLFRRIRRDLSPPQRSLHHGCLHGQRGL